MKTSALVNPPQPASGTASGIVSRLAERVLRACLAALEHGELTLIAGGRAETFGRRTARCALAATVRVHDPRFWTDTAFGGSIGAGESYMRGNWDASDLTAVVRILLANRAVADGLDSGLARLAAPAQRLLHRLARNTRAGSRRNIAAHYDLGNDFFRLFLDPTLMYSSAVFERPEMTLEEASIAKLDRVCRKLDLQPHDHVLEIGSGWGGFALHAARHYGCRVTTTTISRQQFDLARERVAAAGLEGRVTLLHSDYRDLTGQYDKLVSIEMIEAVGHEYFDTYFRHCGRLLRPDGLMLLQAITIADQRYEVARRSVDFIQRYIFPGGALPSIAVMSQAIACRTDLRVVHLEDIGSHYARTLACWRANFRRNLDAVRALGYPESFIRMWEFYLGYCEGGFAEHATGAVQMLLAKPDSRRAAIVPPLG